MNRIQKISTVLLSIIILISFFTNKNNLLVPLNDRILRDFAFGYAMPLWLLFVGTFIVKPKRFIRVIMLALGFFWFGYVALHFLIGFHNPYWGS